MPVTPSIFLIISFVLSVTYILPAVSPHTPFIALMAAEVAGIGSPLYVPAAAVLPITVRILGVPVLSLRTRKLAESTKYRSILAFAHMAVGLLT